MVAGGRAWLWGACLEHEIRSMSGRYASYFNAFLFFTSFLHVIFDLVFLGHSTVKEFGAL